jgi:hypothetical protein
MPDSLWRRIAPRVFAAGNTYTVTNTNDSGPGSFRQAILDANSNPGADTIAFNIPGSGIHTIFPQTTLPAITGSVVIDGYSQPGAKANTKIVGTDAVLLIELDGSQDSTQFGDGLDLSAGNCTVRGLVINSFPQFGINIAFQNPGQNTIAGNYIGTDPTGMQKKGNASTAIFVNQSWNNRIGGTTPADRNVLSGNGSNLANGPGVEIDGTSNTLAQNSLIQGNYIGVNAAGDAAIPNFGGGILLDYVGTTTIGGSAPSSRNVISGNTGPGIYTIQASSNSIVGNYIGTDATGTKAVPNTGSGVRSTASINSFIGSSNQGEGNLISGNAGDGIWFEDSNAGSSDGNKVQNNLIGTAADGASLLPNGGNGIFLEKGANNAIGLINQGAGNIIMFNQGTGVFLGASAGTQNTIRGNSIYSNGGLGIALTPQSPIPNDAGDTDVGQNNLQNYPVLSNASQAGNQTSFNVALNSNTNASYFIDYYVSPTCNPSGFGEGKTLVNSGSVNTDASGNYSGTAALLNLQPGQAITATATDNSGNTSEFSQCLVVPLANVPGSLQLSAPTFNVNENGGSATITVTRQSGSLGAVSVQYSTTNGTASGTDYTATSGTINFADGDSVPKTFIVPILNDPLYEGDETFNVALSNPTGGATLGAQSSAIVTIVDDETKPTLSVSDVTVAEGNAGTTNFTFTVTMSGPSALVTQFNYTTQDGTATAPGDYTPVSGLKQITAGNTSTTITVPVIGDTTIEPDETFSLVISSPVNASIQKGTGTGTIQNDDASAGTLQFSSATYTVNEGGVVTITVTRTGGSKGAVMVFFATSGGTATAGTDYVGVSGDLTFNDGVTSQTFNIAIKDNFRDDPDKTINVSIWNPGGGATLGNPNTAVVTIADDDPPPTLSINDVSVNEGNSGTTNAVFTVTLSAASGKDISVNYATSDGVASAGSDYVATSGTLNIPAGSTSGTITVPIKGDTTIEPDETFFLNLSGAVNTTIAKAQGTGTILNDDTAAGALQFSSAIYNVNENGGAATITVTRTGGSAGTVTVDYATPEGTADSVGDYIAKSGTLTFGNGVTQQSFTIPIVDDALAEPNETVNLSLANPTGGATLGSPKNAVLTILDNDAAPSLSVSDGSVTEGNSGTTNMAFTVSLSAASGQTVTVNYTTADGSATAGADYQAVSGTLTFLPGETTKVVNVPVNGDTQQEQNETFILKLSGPSNATIAKSDGACTILDDDSPATTVQFSAANYDVKEDLTAVTVTLTRSGNSSGTSTVDYATSDDTAHQLSDYELTSGTLNFAAGETSKSFVILINQDSYLEADEKINLLLSNPTGATLGSQSTATVTIQDDAVEVAANPIDDPQNFAYQQYHDLLDREPDTGGLNYWTDELKKCGNDAACISRRRYEVAAAFFIEQEFQQTGYFIYRFHKSAFGLQPSYQQFMHDRSMVMSGPDLETNKLAYAENFVAQPAFLQKYPEWMTGDQFITALLATIQQGTGIDLSAQKQALLADYQANGSRARILRQVADAPGLVQSQYNGAFVLAQYFGYLRREPDQEGYDFWLDVLDHKVPNSLSGYQSLVCAFVTSFEYQKRFGSLTTHSNAECAPK